MGKPHKHAELIKLWADGAEIQWRWGHINDEWETTTTPHWQSDCEFRIKPQPKPDVVFTTHIEYDFGWKWVNTASIKEHNLRLKFDNKTGKLKSAEVIA